jgi:hypothetical protein
MAILFQCQCGRKFKTGDEHAGRSATCPDCRTKLVVPAAATVPAAPQPILPPPIPDEDPSAPEHADYGVQSQEVVPARRRSAAAPYGRSDRDDREDRDDDYNRKRPNYRRPDDRNPFVKRPVSQANGWTDKGVAAGLLMMAGALVWFFGAGLMFDLWFWYPPFLFIAGLVCLIKGLATGKV